jgi:Na+/proline symporter
MQTNDLLLLSILTGPALYMLAIVAVPNPKTTEEYHYASRRLPPEDFVDTTIMYALQVAAISLFATWGYLYGLYSLTVPVFWGFGYLIISYLLKKGKLDSLISSNSIRTIHQFIGANRKPHVRKFAAIITLLAISGPAMFEAFFTASVIETCQSLVAFSPISAEALAIIFLIISTIYMLRGGYSGAVRLDRIQLATGYVLFVAFVSIILWSLARTFNSTFSSAIIQILSVVLILTTMAIFAYRVSLGISTQRQDIYGLLCTGTAFLLPFYPAISSFNPSVYSYVGFNNIVKFFFPASFSAPALVSLFVANAFYQLVDVGNWQRILSVDTEMKEGVNIAKNLHYKDILAASLNNIAISSPLTWVVAILLGLCAKLINVNSQNDDAIELIVKYILSTQNSSSQILVVLLITSMVAIMFSTIDALVSATSFTITNDIFEESIKLDLNVHKRITVAVIIVQLIFYLFISSIAQDSAPSVLYLCWSFQIALVPAVISSLFNIRHKQSTLLSSIFGGCLAAFLPLYMSGPNSVYEWSPTLALLGSIVFLFLSKYIQYFFEDMEKIK